MPIIDEDFGIKDDDALELWPEKGFLRNYVNYMVNCTDAPVIYHLGSAMAALSTASANMDIYVERKDTKFYPLPTHMWIAIMGYSGDRKSKAMTSAMRILKEAYEEYNKYDCLLPADGSIEAWHDFLSDHNNAILYRDELASVLDQSKRSYSDGIKHWLLELDQGEPKRRITKSQSGNDKIIKRPRLTIIGAIPPNVFREKTSTGDWKSGFIARFMFFAATRQRFLHSPSIDREIEHAFAIWLAHVVCASRGLVIISHEHNKQISQWIMDNVESKRMEYPDEIYSNLIRFQDFAYKLMAMYCISRQTTPNTSEIGSFMANDEDLKLTLRVIELLKQVSLQVFKNATESFETNTENKIIQYMQKRPDKPVTAAELVENLQIPKKLIVNLLRTLVQTGYVSIVPAPKNAKSIKGRSVLYYSLI